MTPRVDAASRSIAATPDAIFRAFAEPGAIERWLPPNDELVRSHDLVLDGSDNYPTKYLLADATARLGRPLVYGSVTAWEAMVTVFDARQGPCLRCLFQELMALLHRVTQEPPTMWGPSIVGYGRYRYTYDSGRTGEMPVVGYAIRGRELVLYVTAESDAQQALLARLGPHKMGKSCLYVKRLADLDVGVLEQIVAGSVAEVRRRYG